MKTSKENSSNRRVKPMVIKHICCSCGKEIKKSYGSTTLLSALGMGNHYYYNCGCMDRESFMEISRLLFEKNKDLPDKFKNAL